MNLEEMTESLHLSPGTQALYRALVAELRQVQAQIRALESRLPILRQPRCEFGMDLPNNGGYYRCELEVGHEGQHKSLERV